METEKELNKALSDIYSDLEKLQSAREQVEIVTESSQNLTKSTSILLKELREFSNQFGEENTSNISQLTQSLEDFENRINSISEKGDTSISNYINTFKNQTVEVVDQFSKQLAENQKNLKAINDLNNEKISEKIEQFEKTTKDLKNNTEQVILEMKTNAVIEINKTIQHIMDTNIKADKLIDVITKYDIPNSLISLSQKLEIQEKHNKSLKTLLFVIIGILAVGGFSVIGFLMKFL